MTVGSERIAVAAALFAGLNELGPFNFCNTASIFVFKRFGIAENKLGCFIGDTVACMRFWNSAGALLAFGLSFCGWTGWKAYIAPVISVLSLMITLFYIWYGNLLRKILGILLLFIVFVTIVILFAVAQIKGILSENKGEYGKYICPVVSTLATILSLVFNCMIFYVCMLNRGSDGVRKYYLLLCISGFACGFNQSVAAKVIGPIIAYNILGMEMSNFLAPILHSSAKLLAARSFSVNIDNSVLFGHLMTMCIISSIGMLLWIAFIFLNLDNEKYISATSADKSAKESFMRCISPFFMGIVGFGSIYWLYPVICPTMIVNPSSLHNVQFFMPILGCLAVLVAWGLKDSGDVIFGYDINTITRFDWWSDSIPNSIGKFYNAFWGTIILIILLVWVAISCIHYPSGLMGRYIFHCWPAILCSCIFYFFSQMFRAIGLTGCYANAIGPNFSPFISGGFTTNAEISVSAGTLTFKKTLLDHQRNQLSLEFKGRNVKAGGSVGIMHGRPSVFILYIGSKTVMVPCPTASAKLVVTDARSGGIGTITIDSITLGLDKAEYSGEFITSEKLKKIELKNLKVSGLTVKPTRDGYARIVTFMDMDLNFDEPFISGNSINGAVNYDLKCSFNGSIRHPTFKDSICKLTVEKIKVSAEELTSIGSVRINSSTKQITAETLMFKAPSRLSILVSGGVNGSSSSPSLRGDHGAVSVRISNKNETKHTGDIPCPSLTGVLSGSGDSLMISELDLGFTGVAQTEKSEKFSGSDNIHKVEIKDIKVSGLEVTDSKGVNKTVASISIMLEFQSEIEGTESGIDKKTYDLSRGGSLNSGNSKVELTCVDRTRFTEKSISGTLDGTVVVDTGNSHVSISSLTFCDFSVTFDNVQKLNTPGMAILASLCSRVQLFGTNLSGRRIHSEIMDSSATGHLNLSGNNKLTHTSEITVRGIGAGKAGSFSGPGDKLTRIVISNLAISPGLTIDRYPLKKPVTLTLAFQNGIPYDKGKKGFIIANATLHSAPFAGSYIEFPDGPLDIAHGSTFGTVSLDISLFHMTAMCFASQAYSVGIETFKCAKGSDMVWPTQGLGVYRSFFWWLGYGLKNGNKRFWSLPHADIVSVIS